MRALLNAGKAFPVVVLCMGFICCDLAGRQASTEFPAKVDVVGARGFFLQRSASGLPATLMKVPADANVHVATFYAANGAAVSATTSRALPLGAQYLLLEYACGGLARTAVLDEVSGNLYDLTVRPDNWDRVREKDGHAYYLSAGTLYRLDLASMRATALGFPGDPASYIHVNGNNKVFVFNTGAGPNQRSTLYFENGNAPMPITGTDVEAFWQYLTSTDGRVSIVEDKGTQDVFCLRFGDGTVYPTGELVSQKFDFIDSGPLIGVHAETPIVLVSGSFAPRGAFLSSSFPYLQNGILTDGYSIFRISESSGGLTARISTLPASLQAWADLLHGRCANGKLFFSGSLGCTQIGQFDVSNDAFTVVVTMIGLSSFEPVKDMLFFTTDSATFRYDTVNSLTSRYLNAPAEVQSVMP